MVMNKSRARTRRSVDRLSGLVAPAQSPLMSGQIVRERTFTPSPAAATYWRWRTDWYRDPATGAPAKSAKPGSTTPGASASRPPVQATLPWVAAGAAEFRALVLRRAMDVLEGAGPLTRREIAQHLAQPGGHIIGTWSRASSRAKARRMSTATTRPESTGGSRADPEHKHVNQDSGIHNSG